MYGLRRFWSSRFSESVKLGAVAVVGSCSSQLADPRPVFGAVITLVIALGVEVAGPSEINCVGRLS